MFKGGMGNLMKQAQEMQEKMQQVQEEIAQMEVSGEAGAGMIKVTMNGRLWLKAAVGARADRMTARGQTRSFQAPAQNVRSWR